jgi:hypothetical protein
MSKTKNYIKHIFYSEDGDSIFHKNLSSIPENALMGTKVREEVTNEGR